jgi:hypothetical protein
MNITKQKLGELWEQATSLSSDGPLHQAIIQEYIESCAPEFTLKRVKDCTLYLVNDLHAFHAAVKRYMQQRGKVGSPHRQD